MTHQNNRPIFGVIAAQAADIEQREILSGIIAEAQAADIDIAVLSNIYNPIDTTPVLAAENGIYDLICSDEYDGFILISESIFNADVQHRIIENLAQKPDIPIVVAGNALPDFSLPQFHYINTSGENDLADMTAHLIEVHGFTDIHILTGPAHLDISHKRIQGYRDALEAHGIPYDETKAFFGDFWLNSGKAQAQKYITGELEFPQALICCNDYMAYGFLDECMAQDIPIPEKTAVIGYEYIRERRLHTPILTTFQRNRRALGEAAVRLLREKLETGAYGAFSPPHGTLIPGESCGCCVRQCDAKRELTDMQTKATYDFLNLFSQQEHRLTESRNLDEFVARCWDFQFMIRDVNRLSLCLYEDWYTENPHAENMVCYNLLTYEEPLVYRKTEFSCLFRDGAAPYYFCPLFFAERELGYVVLRFDHPDTFDHIFRNWLKSLANGLEFLRMKNDIRYLTECQNLAEQRDSLTGMYNQKGLQNAYASSENVQFRMVMLRIRQSGQSGDGLKESGLVYAVLDAAEAVRQFCGNHDICGRLDKDTFLCLIRSEQSVDFLTSLLSAILLQHTAYRDTFGVDSFVCEGVPCDARPFAECMAACENLLRQAEKRLS
ncbi:MAG: substrate-binding domain-containing protein, partial [Oscillospiraceae bacterium]|nr:substrate-binding domain-containing protein [Oscillospiraceae bacterium]